MKFNNGLGKFLVKSVLLTLVATVFFACENHRYDSDKRQIIAKDEVKRKLKKITNFNITSFSEDTVKNIPDSNFKTQIRYTLDIIYNDSNKVLQEKKGVVMFTPDGQSVISTQITDK